MRKFFNGKIGDRSQFFETSIRISSLRRRIFPHERQLFRQFPGQRREAAKTTPARVQNEHLGVRAAVMSHVKVFRAETVPTSVIHRLNLVGQG
jgi:hypothetical protein